MTFFKTIDIKSQVEDQLNWMLQTTYEIEMHLNAVLFLAGLRRIHRQPLSNNYQLLWKGHNDLALTKASSLFRTGKRDEKASLSKLCDFLQGRLIPVSNRHIKPKLDEIANFYSNHPNLEKLIKRRDAAAHTFRTEKNNSIVNNDSIRFKEHLQIIVEARGLLQDIRETLLGEKFENETVDVDLYKKIYSYAIDTIIDQRY